MARVNPPLPAALALSFLCLANASHAASLPMLSLTEQSKMDRALLQYMAAHGGNCLSSSDFDCYIVLQGRIPSQQFLDEIGLPVGKLNPASAAEAVETDHKKNFIGSGHNVSRLRIGGFSMVAPDSAHATIEEQCGAVMCGSISTATMKKAGGSWNVTSVKMDLMQ